MKQYIKAKEKGVFNISLIFIILLIIEYTIINEININYKIITNFIMWINSINIYLNIIIPLLIFIIGWNLPLSFFKKESSK